MEISDMCFLHRVPPQMCIIMTSSKGRALYSLEGSMAARVSLALQVNLLRAEWGVTTLRACRAGGPSGSEASGWYRIRSGGVGGAQNVRGQPLSFHVGTCAQPCRLNQFLRQKS